MASRQVEVLLGSFVTIASSFNIARIVNICHHGDFFPNSFRKVQPFFHSEQPYAVFPLMRVPLPQSGQGVPIKGSGDSASAFFFVWEVAGLRSLFFFFCGSFSSVASITVTRRLLLSLRT